MNIQAVSAYVSSAGGATHAASIGDVTEQHGVSRESLADHALERDGGNGAATTDEGASGGYTSSAHPAAGGARVSGTISILA